MFSLSKTEHTHQKQPTSTPPTRTPFLPSNARERTGVNTLTQTCKRVLPDEPSLSKASPSTLPLSCSFSQFIFILAPPPIFFFLQYSFPLERQRHGSRPHPANQRKASRHIAGAPRQSPTPRTEGHHRRFFPKTSPSTPPTKHPLFGKTGGWGGRGLAGAFGPHPNTSYWSEFPRLT